MKAKVKPQKPRNFNTEVTLKGVIIVGMIVFMLLPYFLLQGLVGERKERKDEAVEKITEKWSREQTITGPLLSIPYKKSTKIDKSTYNIEHKATVIAPEQLDITTSLIPETRKYGMFEAVVYRSSSAISGRFVPVDLASVFRNTADATYNPSLTGTLIVIDLSDLRGISEQMILTLDGTEIRGTMQDGDIVFGTGRIDFSQPHNFTLAMELKGSGGINFVPVGGTTNVKIAGEWPDPSFTGKFSPDHTITDSNFTASWNVLNFNRNIPPMWFSSDPTELNEPYDKFDICMGVDLVTGADEYQQNERAMKYAMLFIVLTFVIFFFVEVLTYKRIHPVQYILVAAALVIFYLLLLSLSEIIGFGWAYLLSSIATVCLIMFYTAYIFKNTRQTAMLSGILAGLYAYLYFILQMENFALLVGSIGVFVILGAIMFVSRKVSWYRSEEVVEKDE